ncbi:MAG: LysM domain-containing protein, partial [Rhodobacteraceae bacterium]|nr:LysM domain-containing protein [Paracoccaceae bacterium]
MTKVNGFRQTTIAVVLCAAGLAIPAQAAFQMILAEPTSETVTGNQPAVSRPATPMQPPILPDTAECTATTRAGDTLSSFAKRETGQTEAWREIARMNRLDNPNRIGIGWTLAFPCPADGATDAMVAAIQKVGEALANDTKEDNPDSAGATEISVEGSAAAPWSDEMPPSDAARANTSVPARLRDAPVTPPASESPDDGVTLRPEQKQTQSVTALAAAPDSAPAPATTQPVVPPAASQEASACSATVARGDTLSSIANTWLGSAKRWHEIADLNQITNPDRIPIGKELTLPCGGTV